MAIVERALGGSRARKLRTVFPVRALKGEKVVLTAVRYFVSIVDLRRRCELEMSVCCLRMWYGKVGRPSIRAGPRSAMDGNRVEPCRRRRLDLLFLRPAPQFSNTQVQNLAFLFSCVISSNMSPIAYSAPSETSWKQSATNRRVAGRRDACGVRSSNGPY